MAVGKRLSPRSVSALKDQMWPQTRYVTPRVSPMRGSSRKGSTAVGPVRRHGDPVEEAHPVAPRPGGTRGAVLRGRRRPVVVPHERRRRARALAASGDRVLSSTTHVARRRVQRPLELRAEGRSGDASDRRARRGLAARAGRAVSAHARSADGVAPAWLLRRPRGLLHGLRGDAAPTESEARSHQICSFFPRRASLDARHSTS